MSQANPVYVEFAAKNIDEVLKAMKSIEDTIMGIEKRSAALAKTGSKARGQAKARALGEEVAAHTAAARTVETAQRQSNATVEREAKARLRNITRSLTADFEARRKETARHVADQKKAADQIHKDRVSAWKSAEARISSGVKSETRVDTRLQAQEQIARREIRRGDMSASPALSPQARLAMLRSADGKSPEDRKRIADSVGEMTAENRDRRGARKKAIDEEKRRQITADKEVSKAKRQEDAVAAKQKQQDIKAWNKVDADLTRANKVAARQADHDNQSAQAKREKAAETLYGHGASALRTTGAIVGGVANSVLNAGGGFTVQGSIQDRLSAEHEAAIVANKAPKAFGSSTERVLADAKEQSARYGYDTQDLVRARGKYLDVAGPQNAQDFEDSKSNTAFFAKIAKASGASLDDVATAGGLLKLQNKDLDSAGMQRMLTSVWDQGLRGAIDFDSMAAAIPAITKTATSYSGSQEMNMIHLLGAAQITRGTGSVAESGTALSNISMDAKFHKDEVEAYMGKGVFDKDERLTVPVDELLANILEKTGGKESEIMRMGSGKGVIGRRAIKAFQGAPMQAFLSAKHAYLADHAGDETGANKAGADKVRGLFKTAIGDGDQKRMGAALEGSFANVMKTSAEQFEAAVRELRQEVGAKLVPVLLELVPQLKAMVPEIVKIVEVFARLGAALANHPLLGLAAILGAAFAKELAAAKIAEIIKGILTGGTPATPGAPGTPGAGGGVMTALGAGLIAGTATLAAVKPTVDAVLEGQEDGQVQTGSMIATLKNGPDAEKQAALGSYAAKQEAWGGIGGIARMALDATEAVPNTAYSLITGDKNLAVDDLKKGVAAREVLADPQLLALVKELIAATRQNAPAPAGGPVRQPISFSRGPGPTTPPGQ